ncbi:MAG TPA: CBS domain-containing protein [Acidimicrobiia bacterium]|nr:CBS domain-containing protein [Acidimicrobiia bacterium]
MKICDVMTSPVVTICPDAGWPAVAERIVAARVSGLPVVADDDHLLGVVTEADLLSQPAFGGLQRADLAVVVEAVQGDPCWLYELVKFTAGQLMTTAVIVAYPDEDVSEAARRMLDEHVKWMPVVRNDRVVGVVARRDLLAAAWPNSHIGAAPAG